MQSLKASSRQIPLAVSSLKPSKNNLNLDLNNNL